MVLVLGCHVDGPLGSYASGLAEELSRRGYTVSGASQHLCFIAHLDRRMRDKRLMVPDLTDSVLDGYLVERRKAGLNPHRDRVLGVVAGVGQHCRQFTESGDRLGNAPFGDQLTIGVHNRDVVMILGPVDPARDHGQRSSFVAESCWVRHPLARTRSALIARL